MKRGFLTTAKAKQQLGKDDNDNKSIKLNSTQKPTALSPNQPQVSNLVKYSDFDKIAEPRNFSHGVVDEAGLPEGYDPSKMAFNSKPVDPNDPDAFFFVTLPPVEKGATLANYPGGWTECCISGDVKRVIENTPGFPSPPLQPLGGKPYRITDAGDKGLGVFATRMIRAGELIMDERPLIVTPNSNIEFVRDEDFRQKLQKYSHEQIRQIMLHEMDKRVKKSFDRMPLENQKAFMDLFNSHNHDGSGEYIGRTRTNAAGIDVEKLRDKGSTGKLGQYSATCNEFSRLNHCCCPNAVFHWHTDTFTIRVCAIRDIPAGAEITVEYCHVLNSAAQRAQSLAPYGISSCACSPSCSDPALAKISDERRARFRKPIVLTPPIGGFIPGDYAWFQPALTRLRELEEENLQRADEYRRTLHQLVNIYCFLHDVDKVLLYAHKLDAYCRASDRVKDVDRNLLTREGVKRTQGWMTGQMMLNMQRPGMPTPVLMTFA
ncbi:hypothetical protein EV368DRAFT_62531 [Lentinula lateritia]|nr:hypothetical protein EV368DRAFT_62531 [Lentinula lateritia]